MRYQSFYPFANQQRYAEQRPPVFPNAFQQNQPYMQQPPPQLGPQSSAQAFSPFGFGGPSQQTGASSPGQPGPSKPEMYMETANRLLTTVQQYAPLVQQFAPMIQNLPAMWKLYRGFQSLPAEPAAGAATAAVRPAAAAASAARVPRPSIPRVFQPPV